MPFIIKRYILKAFDSRKVDRIAAMVKSPISTHLTGAKVLTATRSVITGPWKKTKREITKSATAPNAPNSQVSER